MTWYRAAPDSSGNAASPEPEKPARQSAAAFGAIRTLRALFLGTIIVPLILAAAGGYFSYEAHYRAAAAALAEAVAVAAENTTKILDTHVLVAARIEDLLGGSTDPQLRAQEKVLHERIAQQIEGLPQVAAAWAVDAAGRELVSARVFPVDREIDHSGREDFRALRDARLKTFIWALRARSLGGGDYQPYFTVSQRMETPDGRFRGIIVVAVSGAYVASFYNSLLGGSAQYAASVLREDGSSLARYPETAEPAAPREEDSRLAGAIADKATEGVIGSGSPFKGEGSLIAYERLANYPVYVTIERTRASILNEWLRTMAGYAAIGVPAAIGLMLLSLLALRRTRREQSALAEAHDAVTARAAIEAQLHQAQKMEAVGLLTAGIAHDFNNLLTIVSGNITLLEATIDTKDARHQRFIASAMRGCERATDLTRASLELCPPRAGRSPAARHQRGDHAHVQPGVALAGRPGQDQFRLEGDLWPVFVDPNQLESALLNLALNARDAMAGQGSLTIETANLHIAEADPEAYPGVAAGEYVTISISDTGCGMPQEVREQGLRPVLHNEGSRQGNRPRPLSGKRICHAVRGTLSHRQPAGPRNHRHTVPAAIFRRDRAARTRGPRRRARQTPRRHRRRGARP